MAALVGVLHVHHVPSHDSEASFEEVLHAAHAARLDFLVLTDHAPLLDAGPRPAARHEGLHRGPDGRPLLVLVGVELGTREGHLLALDVPGLVPAEDRPAREVIASIHAAGGFAVVPHPFAYGGWHGWDEPFDGLELTNHAVSLRRALGPLLPLRLLRLAFDRDGLLRSLLVRPARELEAWDRLLASGRPVVGFAGADAHRNLSLLGWQLDPYRDAFESVQTVCPETPLFVATVWAALRGGRCWIRYRLHAARAAEARRVRFPSGRVELQLDGGRRLLAIHQPPGSARRGPLRPAAAPRAAVGPVS